MCHDVMLKLLTRSIGKILLVRAVTEPSSGIRYCQIDHGHGDHNDDLNDLNMFITVILSFSMIRMTTIYDGDDYEDDDDDDLCQPGCESGQADWTSEV